MSHAESTHRRLYAQIPPMECVEGCTDCCGPIVFSAWEWAQVEDKRRAASVDCPYSVTGRCEIHDQRPMICRLFGTVDTDLMRCPHGRAPLQMLTEPEGAEIMRQYSEAGQRT